MAIQGESTKDIHSRAAGRSDIASEQAGNSLGLQADLTDPSSSQRALEMRIGRAERQDALRDESKSINMSQSPEWIRKRTVYLSCSAAGDCSSNNDDMTTRQKFGSIFESTSASANAKTLTGISSEVQQVINNGKLETSLQRGFFVGYSDIFDHLSVSQTWDAPMTQSSDNYWAVASRPYEKALIAKLAASKGEIKHADLISAALEACGQDTQLALLTLANFTKNMAAIERRQIDPARIAPDLRDSYDQRIIDSIFHRLQELPDDPNKKYNKEGAIYHFFGALFAASQFGPWASEFMVRADFFQAAVMPGVQTDSVKASAALFGLKCGEAFWHRYYDRAPQK